MYSMPINCLDIWERVTLGLTEIWTTDPLPMIPHQAETQIIASQPFPVSVSGLIPSLSTTPVPCWFRQCQNQAMVTQKVREHPHQLASQTQGLHDTPRSQHWNLVSFYFKHDKCTTQNPNTCPAESSFREIYIQRCLVFPQGTNRYFINCLECPNDK